MLRDNLVGLIEPMLSSAGANPLALCTARKKPSDDRPPCLENPRPAGAESTLTENAASPFHAEPKQPLVCLLPANVLGERCPGDYKCAGLGDISSFSRSSGESSRPDSEQDRPCCTPRGHYPHDWRLASHTRNDRPGHPRAAVFRKLRKETH